MTYSPLKLHSAVSPAETEAEQINTPVSGFFITITNCISFVAVGLINPKYLIFPALESINSFPTDFSINSLMI